MHHDPAGASASSFAMMLLGPDLEATFANAARKKAYNPLDKSLFLGLLAGFWVGIGGLAGTAAAGGLSVEFREAFPVLPRMAVGFFFPFALHFILLFGGELFTGNTMVLTVGLLNKRVPWCRLLLNWTLVYLSNMVGAVGCAYFFGYLTQVFAAESVASWARYVAETKTHYSFGVLFLKAIPANTLVCLGVFLGQGAREATGKFFNMWFPPMLFCLVGYEHSIANMFFIPLGMMYGANATIGGFLYNQAAVVLGNLVGGAVFIGCGMHAVNNWEHSLLGFSSSSSFPAVDSNGKLTAVALNGGDKALASSALSSQQETVVAL